MVPTPLRDALGLRGGSVLQLSAQDGRVVGEPPSVPMAVEERDGVLVLRAEDDGPTTTTPLTAADVRAVADQAGADRDRHVRADRRGLAMA